ncbi:MAG TPA: LPS export ABC transporter periplasmic protein LptC, partial [Gammaproteobacteria bacterium]|nr:LPS export ABC transporter periplasmic protein LptC [Gammaproteobacteria bacterium]
LILMWQEREGAQRAAAPGEPAMDAEIWGVDLRQRDGDERWRLRADHAAHYPGPGETRLTPVHLEVQRAEGPPLTADARRGRVDDGDNRVTLSEAVVLEDPGGYRLTTDVLHYFPDEGRAETDAPVQVTADFGEAEGVGATIWTADRAVALHSAVSTTLRRRPGDAS